MKNKLLIVPGYIVGIGSLCIITYRTLLAFFVNSKAVTIHINRYGEQYADIAFLIFLWIICLVGLVYLYRAIKEGRMEGEISHAYKSDIKGKKVLNKDGLYLGILRNTLIDDKTGMALKVLVEPSKELDQRMYDLDNHGNLISSYDFIKLVDNNIIVGE